MVWQIVVIAFVVEGDLNAQSQVVIGRSHLGRIVPREVHRDDKNQGVEALHMSMRVEKALHRPSSLSSKSSRSSSKGSGKNKGSRDGGAKEDGRARRPVHPHKVLTGSLAWPASLTSSLRPIHLSSYIRHLLYLDTKFVPYAFPALYQKLLPKAIPTDLNDLEQV